MASTHLDTAEKRYILLGGSTILILKDIEDILSLPCISVLCHDGQLRLTGGTTAREGRVEICFSETWGAICDDGWDDLDANVACTSLGYSRFSKLSFISIMHYKKSDHFKTYILTCVVLQRC